MEELGFEPTDIFFRNDQASLAKGCARVLSGSPSGMLHYLGNQNKREKKLYLAFLCEECNVWWFVGGFLWFGGFWVFCCFFLIY